MNLAFYMRLSIADEGENESMSISNQRKVLQKYTNTHLGGRDHVEYIDDGYSGANFERPAIKRLINDCRMGLVDTILVKDLSRFGRNYVDVGDYVEHILPMLGVRFIAIGENVDVKKGDVLELEAVMMNMVNTFYVYDASEKVKATIRLKQEKGVPVTRRTPLGYTCEDVKEGWEIEPVGAAIVKRIFSMAIEGKKTGEIARILNADSAPTPGQLIGAPFKVKEEFIEWDGSMVRRILDNETYTGVLIQGRQQTLVPGKKMKKAGTKVFRHEGHHPAIVSHEAWEKVQKEGKPITQHKVTDWPLKGRVRCAVCNRALSRSANGMLRCKRKECGVEISEENLNGMVLARIKEKRQELAAVKHKEVDTAKENDRIRELRIQQMNEYEKYVNGEIAPDVFTERRVKIRNEINELLAFVEQAEAENKRQTEESIRNKWFLDHSKGNLSTDMVKDLIEGVMVGDEVEVRFC